MKVLTQFAFFTCLALPLAATAQQSTTIDLSGVQFRNATNQSRSSATPISPAFLYDYHITGTARGVGGILGFFYGTTRPLADLLEALAPGSSALLDGQGFNNTGTHPFLVSDERIDGTSVVAGTTITYGFNIRIDIAASGIVSFAITNVVLTPQPTLGYIQIVTGQAEILRTPGVVGGTILLQDFDGDPTTQPVVYEIRNPGSTTVLETQTLNPTAAGTWYFQTALRGTFDITAKSSHWLRKNAGSVSITNAGLMNVNFSLQNGDVDGDNEVSIGDYGILSSQFNTAGPEADLNGDGSVDIGDYSILSTSFGILGDD